ncbi:MAG TPA: hypothetical protein VNT58_04655 [Gaiellaceae bacterium]|nr:hypothetical protein [Gaiellaceae bacterium]
MPALLVLVLVSLAGAPNAAATTCSSRPQTLASRRGSTGSTPRRTTPCSGTSQDESCAARGRGSSRSASASRERLVAVVRLLVRHEQARRGRRGALAVPGDAVEG